MMRLFRNFIDETNISETELDKFSYSTDASRIKGKTELVIWPRSIEDLQKICQISARHNITVTPRGAGCNLVGGAVPLNSIVVDMSKMNRVIGVTNEYAYVESGVVVDNLNKMLKERKFPLAPLNHQVASIGGLIASNAFCSRTSEIGRMIDWILEMEVVDGTGKYQKLTGDSMRHFVGLEGATGIIAKAKLKLETPEKKSFSVLSFNTIDAMNDYLDERSNNPIRTDLLDEVTSELLGFEPKLHLIEVHQEGVGTVKDENESELLDNLHETLDWKLKKKGYSIIESPGLPEENVEKMIYWLRKNNVPSYAHLGCNIFLCYFKDNSREIEQFRQVVKNLKGNLAHGFGFGLKYKDLISQDDKKRIEMLKESYDPKNIMNRGKML